MRGESSKVVKNPFSRFSDAPAAAACVQRGGYHGLQGCCSKGDDLVAALDAVRAEEGRLGASRITSCGYFLQSSVCQNAKSRRPHPKLC